MHHSALLHRLKVAAVGSISDGVVPDVGHQLAALVVGVGAVGDEVQAGAAVTLHISKYDATALVLPVPDEAPNLLVVLADLVGGRAVAEQGRHDDGSGRRASPDGVHEAGDAHADVGDVDVARAVVGAGVDEDEVGPHVADVGLGLALDLVDDEARPALVLRVRHVAPRVAAHVRHVVAVAVEPVAQERPVPVPGAGADAVRDGRPQRHDPQEEAVGEAALLERGFIAGFGWHGESWFMMLGWMLIVVVSWVGDWVVIKYLPLTTDNAHVTTVPRTALLKNIVVGKILLMNE